MIKTIIVIAFFSVLPATSYSAWSNRTDYRFPLNIPAVPSTCKLIIYGPLPKGIMGDKGEKNTDWGPLLKTIGVLFPPGGFAIFYKPARILVVATDSQNQDIVGNLCQ